MRGKNLSPFYKIYSIKINLTDSSIAERRSQNVHVDPINCPRKAHSARRKRERERRISREGKAKERGINLTTRIIKLSVETLITTINDNRTHRPFL